MAEGQKFGTAKLLQLLVPVISAIIAVVSLFLGLAARKKEISCTYLGSEKLISLSSAVMPGLKLDYNGKPVTTLTKMSFVLRNSGAAAVKAEDIREPLSLEFPNDVKLLNAVVDRTLPTQFAFGTPMLTSLNGIGFQFNLLNPGDEAYFAVYVYNSSPEVPVLAGRVVDVGVKQTLNLETAAQSGKGLTFLPATVRKAAVWALTLVNGGAALFFAGLWLYGVGRYVRFAIWRSRWISQFEGVLKDLKEPEGNRALRPATRVSRLPQAKAELELKKIPAPKDNTFFEDWGDILKGALIFGGITLLCGLSSLCIYTGPR